MDINNYNKLVYEVSMLEKLSENTIILYVLNNLINTYSKKRDVINENLRMTNASKYSNSAYTGMSECEISIEQIKTLNNYNHLLLTAKQKIQSELDPF